MHPTLYRRRLIPFETVLLKSDEILYADENVIKTKWKPIRPRKDIGGGESWYFIHSGIKVSRFYDNQGQFIYWYCDIIEAEYQQESNTYIFTDLLVDVVIYPSGFVKVLDIEELNEALDNGLLTIDKLQLALKHLATLLNIIYAGDFEKLTQE